MKKHPKLTKADWIQIKEMEKALIAIFSRPIRKAPPAVRLTKNKRPGVVVYTGSLTHHSQ